MFLKAQHIHNSFWVAIQSSHTLTLGRMMARTSNAQRTSTEASAANGFPSLGEQQVSGEAGLREDCPWGNWDGSCSDSSLLSSHCGRTPSPLAAVSFKESSVIGLISPPCGLGSVCVLEWSLKELSL